MCSLSEMHNEVIMFACPYVTSVKLNNGHQSNLVLGGGKYTLKVLQQIQFWFISVK